MTNSSVYTVGSTLRMADNDGNGVTVLVEGQWFGGEIVGMDGDGVLLRTETGTTMIRLAAITVVRIHEGSAPALAPADQGSTEPAPPMAPVLRLSLAPADTETVLDASAADASHSVVEEILSGAAMAKLPASTLLADLPEDLTEAEREAVLRRRAELAQSEATAPSGDEPVVGPPPVDAAQSEEPAVAEQVDAAQSDEQAAEAADEQPRDEQAVEGVDAPEGDTDEHPVLELVTGPEQTEALDTTEADLPTGSDPAPAPAAQTEQPQTEQSQTDAEAPAEVLQSSTQSDDWRAMLISLRQQAQAPISEPEKRKWRIAR